MNLMALIPARAGSKGLKNKNLLPFGKNSLVERTFHLVGEILEKEKVILSSDYKFEVFSKFLKKSHEARFFLTRFYPISGVNPAIPPCGSRSVWRACSKGRIVVS